jgi:UDP-N-acetylglucosamine 2-epimerase
VTVEAKTLDTMAEKICDSCANPRISLFIGTKAQFIKMIPIAWELDARCIPYRLINTGQHKDISNDLRRQYDISQAEISLGGGSGNVSTLGHGITWLVRNLVRYTIRAARTRRQMFDGTGGIALVHGDTASTLLSAIIAKRAGQEVMHIEAGLRSWRVFHPFPEELVRILVMRMSDYLIAPSEQAYANLVAMSLTDRARKVSGNTGLDIVAADMRRMPERTSIVERPYCVATIHRMETLYKRSSMQVVVDSVLAAHGRVPVVFVQHGPTARRLAAYGMLERLEKAGVRQTGLMDHAGFVHLLSGAEFILTDGGSVQEEASYLGVPCLLMRVATERADGLGENVVLSEMDEGKIRAFIEDHQQYRRKPLDFSKLRPSAEIVDIVESMVS